MASYRAAKHSPTSAAHSSGASSNGKVLPILRDPTPSPSPPPVSLGSPQSSLQSIQKCPEPLGVATDQSVAVGNHQVSCSDENTLQASEFSPSPPPTVRPVFSARRSKSGRSADPASAVNERPAFCDNDAVWKDICSLMHLSSEGNKFGEQLSIFGSFASFESVYASVTVLCAQASACHSSLQISFLPLYLPFPKCDIPAIDAQTIRAAIHGLYIAAKSASWSINTCSEFESSLEMSKFLMSKGPLGNACGAILLSQCALCRGRLPAMYGWNTDCAIVEMMRPLSSANKQGSRKADNFVHSTVRFLPRLFQDFSHVRAIVQVAELSAFVTDIGADESPRTVHVPDILDCVVRTCTHLMSVEGINQHLVSALGQHGLASVLQHAAIGMKEAHVAVFLLSRFGKAAAHASTFVLQSVKKLADELQNSLFTHVQEESDLEFAHKAVHNACLCLASCYTCQLLDAAEQNVFNDSFYEQCYGMLNKAVASVLHDLHESASRDRQLSSAHGQVGKMMQLLQMFITLFEGKDLERKSHSLNKDSSVTHSSFDNEAEAYVKCWEWLRSLPNCDNGSYNVMACFIHALANRSLGKPEFTEIHSRAIVYFAEVVQEIEILPAFRFPIPILPLPMVLDSTKWMSFQHAGKEFKTFVESLICAVVKQGGWNPGLVDIEALVTVVDSAIPSWSDRGVETCLILLRDEEVARTLVRSTGAPEMVKHCVHQVCFQESPLHVELLACILGWLGVDSLSLIGGSDVLSEVTRKTASMAKSWHLVSGQQTDRCAAPSGQVSQIHHQWLSSASWRLLRECVCVGGGKAASNGIGSGWEPSIITEAAQCWRAGHDSHSNTGLQARLGQSAAAFVLGVGTLGGLWKGHVKALVGVMQDVADLLEWAALTQVLLGDSVCVSAMQGCLALCTHLPEERKHKDVQGFTWWANCVESAVSGLAATCSPDCDDPLIGGTLDCPWHIVTLSQATEVSLRSLCSSVEGSRLVMSAEDWPAVQSAASHGVKVSGVARAAMVHSCIRRTLEGAKPSQQHGSKADGNSKKNLFNLVGIGNNKT